MDESDTREALVWPITGSVMAGMPEQWRETNVRFYGPTVAALQAAFASGWAETTGELLTGDLFFPPVAFEDRGNVNAGLMHSLPTIGSTPAERFYALTIAGCAEDAVHLELLLRPQR